VSTTEQRVQAGIAETWYTAAVLRARLVGRTHMLYTIAVILLVAWLLGFVGIYAIGSFVHVLLVIAIVLFLVGLLRGRRVLG
jgi:uncharacterized membrane protein YtjA (UPF0391 family)